MALKRKTDWSEATGVVMISGDFLKSIDDLKYVIDFLGFLILNFKSTHKKRGAYCSFKALELMQLHNDLRHTDL